MKNLINKSIGRGLVLAILLALFGLASPAGVRAATSPSLGAAASFGILASTFTPASGVTTIVGDLGYTTLSAGSYTVSGGTDYGSGAPYSTAGTDQGTALTALSVQPCTFSFAAGAINLSTDTTHGAAGVYGPGVYCTTGAGAASIGTAGITLSGAGTYIFRINGALTSVDNSQVRLADGASSCDVFWTPTAATTLGANTSFVGTVIDDSGITVGNTTSWSGRALAFGGTVTTDNDAISASCSVAALEGGSGTYIGTINVVKIVVNDNGRTKTVADFPLFVNGIPVTSGETNSFQAPAPAYTITETVDVNYARAFSGDCDINGQIGLSPGDNRFCIITNDDIGAPAVVPPVPPLIDVVKTASPLALPSGPGLVNYTYTLRNIGTVPATNITMVGDTCSPITMASGDTDADSQLDVNETWVYRCATTLQETHTNTVVATGWANGISAVDIASAMVIVGEPVVPPLIHVTKIPSPLTLLAGGGWVTYTNKVTNPGTVALSNVRLTDNKCSAVRYVSGDSNGDAKLDSSETWTYSCRSNLAQTTVNTVVATGEANGLTARDFAIATVVVAAVVPGLPNTGLAAASSVSAGAVIVSVLMLLSAVALALVLRKRLS